MVGTRGPSAAPRSPELPAAPSAGLGCPGMLNKLQAPSLREDPIPGLDSRAGTAGRWGAGRAGLCGQARPRAVLTCPGRWVGSVSVQRPIPTVVIFQ